jgi:hypothetical protein
VIWPPRDAFAGTVACGGEVRSTPGLVEQGEAMSQRHLEAILDPSYLDGLAEASTQELRRRRAECEEQERGLSYARRVLQGRLDILRAELLRREQGGDETAGSLLSRLPDILGRDQAPTDPLQARATPLDVPEHAEDYGDQVDAIVSEATMLSLPERSESELADLIDRLAAYETELSGLRRQLFGLIDRIRDELAARYKDGRANIGELLGTDG